ncbi:hypothetical protein BDZ94DRAFT_1258399 [Collybia nuda]|uniref:Uncharacterized protein n=1 Tax=Collybia nuda TaxID=64659 RepID=A0A9P5Y7Q4_9AGAR|nr:hypothetical protein BDZ94DRAFT_1258399 [Collybia nuda]
MLSNVLPMGVLSSAFGSSSKCQLHFIVWLAAYGLGLLSVRYHSALLDLVWVLYCLEALVARGGSPPVTLMRYVAKSNYGIQGLTFLYVQGLYFAYVP